MSRINDNENFVRAFQAEHDLTVDGWAGKKTMEALYKKVNKPMPQNRSPIPNDNVEDIIKVYGHPGTTSNLVACPCPYPLTLAWNKTNTIQSFMCHKLVVDDLVSIFNSILNLYGNFSGVKEHRMHLFGGCYNFRQMTSGSGLSRHAWGIAIDLDPDNNQYSWNRAKAKMPEEVISIFAQHGWKSGGRAWGKDYMHFQRTK
jgi:hypothetical protein